MKKIVAIVMALALASTMVFAAEAKVATKAPATTESAAPAATTETAKVVKVKKAKKAKKAKAPVAAATVVVTPEAAK